MPLTTVARGRVFDWSHAVGRGAARGTGFNYIQTMCLGKNGDLYATNRGNENNFGMHANKVQLGGPGEEELLADFFEYGEGDGNSIWPFGIAVDDERDRVYCSDEWTNTISVFDTGGKLHHEIRRDRQRRRRIAASGRPGGREERQSDRRRQRQQPPAGVQPRRQVRRQMRRAGKGPGEFNQPWGITLDKDGNIYVADWKNHRIQKLSPEGKPLMCIGSFGKLDEAGRRLCGDDPSGPMSPARAKRPGIRGPISSITRPMSRSTATATSMCATGATIGSACSTPRAARSPH